MAALIRRLIGSDRDEDEVASALWGERAGLALSSNRSLSGAASQFGGDDAQSMRSGDFDDGRSMDGRCGLDKDQERQYKQLYDAFLIMEASLQKYWKTCTAFLEVSSLMQEGVDQMTADVLSFCSSMEEDAMIQRLEHDALCMRDGMACEDVVNESVRKHLLGPMGDRLAFFQAIKVRARDIATHRRAYREQRKKLGKMRVDRKCNPVRLKAAEHELGVLANKFESTFRNLVGDLQDLHENRAQILREPFDALRRCQIDFMQHLSGVLAADMRKDEVPCMHDFEPVSNQHEAQVPNWDMGIEDSASVAAEYHVPFEAEETLSVRTGNASQSIAEQLHQSQAQSMHPERLVSTSTSLSASSASPAMSEPVASSSSAAVLTQGHRPRQRHQVAQIVKDFHLLRGRRIFERPEQFRALEVAPPGRPGPLARVQGETADADDSTYAMVRRFAASVRRVTRGSASALDRDTPANDLDETSAARKLQGFARTVAAQSQARALADQIFAVHRDNAGYTFYSNPHTGYMSWTRPLFVRRGGEVGSLS
ncbi:Hypothetical Protein FCC1311_009362 [Hondaea fermentalgiana]|uniref:BAR domain-containing protein n=1 Tax=Hondaea fermentalgiana TaxID=2315210 RepID=A0A2R5G4K3_9STRA|nr:Hypothetical Protein FCC1311_009362 [Hondaea fermentalgiana]|eukprot:GBG24718.1 Hypothetical Protein FCC1311_009362 [Hondaea fermentalgiana]